MAETSRPNVTAIACSVVALAVAAGAGWLFMDMHRGEPIIAGSGVTTRTMLSDTETVLKGTPGDTPVYDLTGATPGGTFMLLGGTHPQEIAGLLAAIIVIENATVTQGRVLVVPQANQSGFTHTDPMEGFPHTFHIDTAGGPRWFRNGMRLANPVDMWPDPDVYVHKISGEEMVGLESRNLNRNHPGHTPGTLLAEVSHGLITMAQTQNVNVILDMHEAQPEYPVINKMIAHENAFETAATAQFLMSAEGVEISLDSSPKNLHGLSHREFGDHTQAQAILTESANPGMGRFRGRTDENLIVNGRDVNYAAAAPMGRLFVPFTEEGWPLVVRVARQLSGVRNILEAYNELNPDTPIVVTGIPTYQEVIDNGIGAYLKAPPAGDTRPIG
jgi:hypothetical protein